MLLFCKNDWADIFNKTGSKIKTESSTSRPGSHYKMGSQRGTPQPAEETEEPPIREPTPVPHCSIYMQTIEWLIEVKAVPVSVPNMELFYYLSLNWPLFNPHNFFFGCTFLHVDYKMGVFILFFSFLEWCLKKFKYIFLQLCILQIR